MRFKRRRRANTLRSNAPGRSHGLAHRHGMLEMLEKREMLAGDIASSWHNTLNPRDVNFDQRVSTSDLMVVVNELLRNGQHSLQADQATPLNSLSSTSKPRYLDVNNDGRVSVSDALMVVNALLDTHVMLVTTEVTDLANNPITQIAVGQQYKVQTIVQDIREPEQELSGVFAAAADITFNSSLSTIDAGQTVQFGSFFDFLRESSLQQGRVVGWASAGAIMNAPGNAPQFLFSVVLTASAAGIQTFTPTFDTTDQDHEYLLVDPPNPLSAGDVQFVGDTLEILAIPGFSVAPVSQNEGDVDSTFNFTVSLSQASAEETTVQYTTTPGTATAGSDYVATSGTLTFEAGQTTAVIPVTVKGDTNVEPNETFNVVLSNPSSNATILGSSAIGTILNDDVQGVLSIAGSVVNNVTSGTTNGVFTVSLNQAVNSVVTVQYSTANGSALDGVDYEATSGTLTFNPGGGLSQVVPVTILGNAAPDDVDTFFVNLSNPSSNAAIGNGQATIQINPAVTAISAAISPSVVQSEGAGGDLTSFVFTIALSAASSENITVSWSTQDGTATTGNNDYQAASGTVTFAPGATSQAVTVQVVGDNVNETSENFFVNFNAESGAVGSGTGVGTILDDDGAPTLTINDVTVSASQNLTQAVFIVTLSGAVTQPVTVGFATSDGSAVAGEDYLVASGNLQFQPGDTTKTITVTILSTSTPDADRTFFVNLSSPTGGATIGDDLGVGTIITQGLSISDAVVVEGNSGTRDAVFTVTLSRPSDSVVTVAYSTLDGTATLAGDDYEAAVGTLTFAPSATTQLITVQINGDTSQEADETFRVALSNAVGSPIFNSQGVGTILNDDGQSVTYVLSLSDTSGNALPINTQFDVGDEFYLDVTVQDVQISPQGVFQAYLDVLYDDNVLDVIEGSLEFGSFFPAEFAQFDFEAGLLNDFGAFGDISGPPANPSAPQLLYRVRFKATDVGLATFTGSVDEEDLNDGSETLLYGSDQPVPSEQMSVAPQDGLSINIGSNVITVANTSANEAGQMVFTVTRFLPSAETATVVFNTVNGTAIAGQDYTATSGTLTFDAQNPVRFVTVQILNDTTDEPDETFSLVLSAPQGASVSASAATGTIIDDDGPVSVSVAGSSASEGSGVVFNVSLSAASGKTVTVAYATTGSGTATSGVDYTPVSGTLTFAPGTTLQSVTVPTLGDVVLEASETFQLAISAPSNATLGTSQATGTIIDVPPAGLSGYVYVDLNNNGIKDANETGIEGAIVTVTNSLSGASQSTTTAADGSYTFLGLIPGTYTITETQPGFYSDGRDTRFGIDSPLNDQFAGIALAPSAGETGFNFGEGGIRADFISAFLNRRALFASAAVTGNFGPNINLPGSVLDLRTGDIWVSFDGGWSGLRQIDALFDSANGSASMRLYNNNLQEVALSSPSATGAVLLYNGTPGQTYFLKITGSNPSVTVQITDPTAFSNLVAPSTPESNSTTSTTSDPPASTSTTTYVYNRFGVAVPQTAPSADALVAEESSEEAFAEEEDWVLESLLA